MKQIVQNSNIFTVDAHYVLEELASIHLMRSQDCIAIIDTGTKHSIPQVKSALTEIGLGFDAVQYIILTHIHLDHAGGAGALMQLCDNARLVVHERGARHMMDPAKLIAGTVAVYGQDGFDRLYGEIVAVDEQRIVIPKDGETIDFQSRALTFLDSPGHASHHHCIVDHQTNSIFTGDTLGLSYPALRYENEFFLMPISTPVQFKPEAMHASIDKVMSYQPEWLYLTHYSAIQPNDRIIAGLHEQIDDFVRLTEQCAQTSEANFLRDLNQALFDYLVRRCQSEIPQVDIETVHKWVKFDAELDAQGLVFWWNRYRKK